jgi:hypothetical protein
MAEKSGFLAPDLHSPRNRDKIKDYIAYPDKDPYKFFARLKVQYPQLQQYTNRQISDWIHDYNKQMANEVASNRYGVKLPERLGAVVTGLCKPTQRTASFNIDYSTSGRLGTAVPHRNGNTNGYLAKVYYTNDIPRCRFQGHRQWIFKPVRALSRAVSAIMKEEATYSRYIVFTGQLPVSALFNKRWNIKSISRRVKKQKKEQEAWIKAMAEYDELRFD